MVLEHPEIDTHQIVSEGSQAARMLDPAMMDPHQLQHMGLGHLGVPRGGSGGGDY